MVDTKTRLEEALKDAMRSHDDLRKRTLRMALAAIRNAEIDRGGKQEEPAVLALLQKEVKTRQESLAEAQHAGRADMQSDLEAEIALLETFLPQPLSAQELEDLARQAIAETGASSPREMGQVMKILIPRLQGRATGDQASQAVRRLLQ
jgi:uncharacterized protein YqeY